jgi:hypothetical protein
MNFLNRLKYYMLGLGLGSLLVYIMLVRNRTDLPVWTPNDRVLQELRLADLTVAQDVTIPFTDSVLQLRIRQSSVLFSESDVRSDSCRTYQLDSDTERMRFRICGKNAQLVRYEAK